MTPHHTITLCAALLAGSAACGDGDSISAPSRTANTSAVSASDSDASFDEPTSQVVKPTTTICETRTIDTNAGLPDMLVVLDRSLSMTLNFRWEPSKAAVKSITHDFDHLIRFGLSSFPNDTGCAGGTLEVPIRPANGDAIANRLDLLTTVGVTPTGAALSHALTVLGDRSTGDATTRPAYVLLVTDGVPSCNLNGESSDPAQQDAARAAVKALKTANVPTYVLGFQIDPAFEPLMNELAQLGGTNSYRPVEDADEVVDTFREITRDVIKCSFELSEPPGDPHYVRVTLDAQTLAWNGTDGWALDGKTITLRGRACSKLKDGRGHTVKAVVECSPIVLN